MKIHLDLSGLTWESYDIYMVITYKSLNLPALVLIVYIWEGIYMYIDQLRPYRSSLLGTIMNTKNPWIAMIQPMGNTHELCTYEYGFEVASQWVYP